eukprot:EG_transcript_23445
MPPREGPSPPDAADFRCTPGDASEAEESPPLRLSSEWPLCAVCHSHEPLTGPLPPTGDRLTWFECATCQRLVHAWCLGLYRNMGAPAQYRCPRCVALTAPASGPLQLGDLVWARQSPSATPWPAYLAAPPPDGEAADAGHVFVAYYVLDRAHCLAVQAAYALKTDVCRLTLDATKVFPGRKKDRQKLANLLPFLFPASALPTSPPAPGNARPPAASKRPPASHPSSPTIKRPKLADASPHEAVPTGPFIAASDSWDDPDLDKNVQGLLQDVGLE